MNASITLTNGTKIDVDGSVQEIADLVSKLDPPRLKWISDDGTTIKISPEQTPAVPEKTMKDLHDLLQKMHEERRMQQAEMEQWRPVPHWPAPDFYKRDLPANPWITCENRGLGVLAYGRLNNTDNPHGMFFPR